MTFATTNGYRCLFFLTALLSVCLNFLHSAGGKEASVTSAAEASQIYPTDHVIELQTRRGFVYRHVQGKDPDWGAGALGQIAAVGEQLEGNGQVLSFKGDKAHSFHMVEEWPSCDGPAAVADGGPTEPQPSYVVETGSLRVRVNTGPKATRMDSLTFVLKDPQGNTETYPRGRQFRDDPVSKVREFTLRELPIGTYTLEFYIDNEDGLFATLPPRVVPIRSNQVTEIDEFILPRFGGVDIALSLPSASWGQQEVPEVSLIDAQGYTVVSSANGYLAMNELIPGKYTVRFASVEGLVTPEPIPLQVEPSKITGPHVGRYVLSEGSLVLKYDAGLALDRLDRIRVWLTDEAGERQTYPKADAPPSKHLASQREIHIDRLATGTYKVEFLLPNSDGLFESPTPTTVEVRHAEVTELQRSFAPNYASVQAQAKVLGPDDIEGHRLNITLKDSSGQVVRRDNDGKMLATQLAPGSYEISFSELDRYVTPEPVAIELKAGEELGPFVGEYHIGTGSLEISYSTGERAERLDQVFLWLTDEEGNREFYPQSDESVESTDGKTRKILIPDLPIGKYEVEFFLPNHDNAFHDVPLKHLEVNTGKFTKLHEDIIPRYGTVSVELSFPYSDKPSARKMPVITITNSDGQTVAESNSGALKAVKLMPGDYQARFSTLDGSEGAQPISFTVEPDELKEPIIQEYRLGTGTIHINYETGPKNERLNKVGFWVTDERGFLRTFSYNDSVEAPNGKGRVITLKDIPVGVYQIETRIPNEDGLFVVPAEKTVILREKQEAQVDQEIRPQYGGLEVLLKYHGGREITSNHPEIRVEDASGQLIARSPNGYLLLTDMTPGSYRIYYEQHPYYLPVNPQTVTVEPNGMAGPIQGDYHIGKAELVISYDMQEASTLLKRVNFSIADADGKHELYPKGRDVIVDEENGSYKVVFPEMEAGKYQIAFVVPHAGKVFKEVAIREIELYPNDKELIHQSIIPRYGSLDIRLDFLGCPAPRKLPKVLLKHEWGEWTFEPDSYDLALSKAPPGKYTVSFEELEKYTSPEEQWVTVEPEADGKKVVATYTWGESDLEVEIDAGNDSQILDKVKLVVNGTHHQEVYTASSEEYLDENGVTCRRFVVRGLPVGRYHVSAQLPELNELLAPLPETRVDLAKGRREKVRFSLEPKYARLEVKQLLPEGMGDDQAMPSVTVASLNSDRSWSSEDPEFVLDKLLPGKYAVHFHSSAPLIAPEPITIKLDPGEQAKPIKADYRLAKGSLTLRYSTGDLPEYLPEVAIQIINNGTQKSQRVVNDHPYIPQEGARRSHSFDGLLAGSYTVQVSVPGREEIFGKARSYPLDLRDGASPVLEVDLAPRYGSLGVLVQFPADRLPKEMPGIVVLTSDGKELARSYDHQLELDKVLPGDYRIQFLDAHSYVTPAYMDVTVEPESYSGPYAAEYKVAKGTLRIVYDTGPTRTHLDEVEFELIDSRGVPRKYPGKVPARSSGSCSKEIVIEDLPEDNYQVYVLSPQVNGLFSTVQASEIEVIRNSVTVFERSLEPQFAALEVLIVPNAQLPAKDKMPAITVKDDRGQQVDCSYSGRLSLTHLVPGVYHIDFGDYPDLKGPKSMTVELKPGQQHEPIEVQYRPARGSLELSYRTDKKKVRLDRVRFWLSDEHGNRTMYPKDGAVVQQADDTSVLVRIDDLLEGNYTVEFLVPNHDQLFKEVPKEDVFLLGGETRKLDFTIKPSYGHLQASLTFPEDAPKPKELPEISVVRVDDGECICRSANGELEIDDLHPGDYVINFESIGKFNAPAPMPVVVKAGETVGPVVAYYEMARGDLVVAYNTGPYRERLSRVRFWVFDENGDQCPFYSRSEAVTDPANNGIRVSIPNVPAGTYTVEFFVPNIDRLFEVPEPQVVEVEHGKEAVVNEYLKPNYGRLNVAADVPPISGRLVSTPVIQLREESGLIVASSSSGTLSYDRLTPGTYQVFFEDVENYRTPKTMTVTMTPGQKLRPIVAAYHADIGSGVITVDTGKHQERLDELSFTIIDTNGDTVARSKDYSPKLVPEKKGLQYTIPMLKVGAYTVKFDIPNEDNLFPSNQESTLLIEGGETSHLAHSLKPQYGAIDVVAKLPPSIHREQDFPRITVENQFGDVVANSREPMFSVEDLVPGKYFIHYHDNNKLHASKGVEVHVGPGMRAGPFAGVYRRAESPLTLVYGTGKGGARLDQVSIRITDEDGNTSVFSEENAYAEDVGEGVRQITIDAVATGVYQVEFVVPNEDQLFLEHSTSTEVRVKKGEENISVHHFLPQYGSLEASIDFTKGPVPRQLPQIYLKDRYNNIYVRSDEGRLLVEDLTPGKYTVEFQEVEGYLTPKKQEIRLDPNEFIGPIVGEYELATGSLVVNYFTNPQQLYLNDISFVLKNEYGSVVELPEGVETVYDKETHGYRVSVPDLPVGLYKVEFSVPDTDGLIPQVLPQEVQIGLNEKTFLEQGFVPRYGGIEAAIKMAPTDNPPDHVPVAILKTPEGEEITRSENGYLLSLDLVPGAYRLEFEDLASFNCPESFDLFVAPSEVKGPYVVMYKEATGHLKISYETNEEKERLDEVRVWITDDQGQRTLYEPDPIAEESDEGVRMVTLKDLPVGDYSLEFFVPNTDNLFPEVPNQRFTVKRGEVTEIHEVIEPQYASLVADVNFDETVEDLAYSAKRPDITLRDAEGRVHASAVAGQLVAKRLPPGEYELVYEDLEQCRSPEPIKVRLEPRAQITDLQHTYSKAQGSAIITYNTGRRSTRLDDVSFTLTDQDGNVHKYPGRLLAAAGDEFTGRRVSVDELPAGTYALQWQVPNEDDLFDVPETEWIEIKKDEVTAVEQTIHPRYGGVDAAIAFLVEDKTPDHLPKVKLIDEDKQVVAESTDGKLWSEELIPGEYQVIFEETPNYYTPKPQTLNISAAETIGPILGEYELAKGGIRVKYNTGVLNERIDRVRFWLEDEYGNRTMYPKEKAYTDPKGENARMVSIDDLPVGSYTVEFILPNRDNLFVPMNRTPLVVEKDEVTELNFDIVPQYGSIEASYQVDGEVEALPGIRIRDDFGELQAKSDGSFIKSRHLSPGQYEIVFPEIKGYKTPEPVLVTLVPNGEEGPFTVQYERDAASLSVRCNEDKRWSLYRNGEIVMSEVGTKGGLYLPPGDGYYLMGEEIPGYTVRVEPDGTFSMDGVQPLIASVDYQEEFGKVELSANVKDGEIVTVTLDPQDGRDPIRKSLHAAGGKIQWSSDDIPIGTYEVSYELPYYYRSQDPESIEIEGQELVKLNPEFKSARAITVATNLGGASYTLVDEKGTAVAEGKGDEFAFENVLPGKYTVQFSDVGRGGNLAPESREVEVTKEGDIHVDAGYKKAASLVVSSNISEYKVRVTPRDGSSSAETHTITHKSRTFRLPEGLYEVEFLPLEGAMAARFGGNQPDIAEVRLGSSKPQRIHGIYEANKGSLVVTSNLAKASYTVRDVTDGDNLVIGRFHGEYTVIPMTIAGTYIVEFDALPNYTQPEAMQVVIASNERQTVGGNYTPTQQVVSIPEGPVIVGDIFGEGAVDEKPSRTVNLDTFGIGIYPVTNAQYAAWLTKAVKEGIVQYISSTDLQGQVKDLSGHLLFETVEADSNSQVAARMGSNGIVFEALPGKEEHPVIEVSWYGANAYCQDNKLRLPTEAEWEKASGMAISRAGQSLKKFRYGFGSDSIDKNAANYMHTYKKVKPFRARTTEVGFYNGINLLPHSRENQQRMRANPSLVGSLYGTKQAKSPYGLYDTSGNVREWTADWYDPKAWELAPDRNPQGPGHGNKKVTKGGSYDSFAYEVRVSSRMPLSPETTDAYTGFRVVMPER